MSRLFNFCAGPSTLPKSVLDQAQQDFLDWNNLGASVMEISHRSKPFIEIAQQAEQDLRDLLNVPDNYKVLFLQGGAYGQFSGIPLNLLGTHTQIDLIETGTWSEKAAQCAANYAKVNILATTSAQKYTTLPDLSNIQASSESAYVFYCSNETINGVEFQDAPVILKCANNKQPDLVADMSSNILSRKINVADYGLIFAGAQKNIGPSGLVLVIVREDLLDRAHIHTPDVFNYAMQAQNGSMLNTPPTFSWYMVGLVFKWLKANGGIAAIEKVNIQKANALYKTIDESDFYSNPIAIEARSRMNVPFILKDESLNARFIAQAKDAGLINLEGHRMVGGMRASIYNAMPLDGVLTLCEFMRHFEKTS